MVRRRVAKTKRGVWLAISRHFVRLNVAKPTSLARRIRPDERMRPIGAGAKIADRLADLSEHSQDYEHDEGG